MASGAAVTARASISQRERVRETPRAPMNLDTSWRRVRVPFAQVVVRQRTQRGGSASAAALEGRGGGCAVGSECDDYLYGTFRAHALQGRLQIRRYSGSGH